MRHLRKIGQDRYIEVDTDTDKPTTTIMTEVEAYFYRLSHQCDDLACTALETANKNYDVENREIL